MGACAHHTWDTGLGARAALRREARWPRGSCCSLRWEAKSSRQRSCEHTSAILQVCQSPNRAPPALWKWRGTNGNNGARRFFSLGGCSLLLGGLPRLPQLPRHPYVASFTCLLSEAAHSARGCPAGVTASSIRVFDFARGRVSSAAPPHRESPGHQHLHTFRVTPMCNQGCAALGWTLANSLPIAQVS